MEPIELIVWICVFTFAATVIITLLALLRLIKLPNETFLPKLFQILIVEIVIAGVGAFSSVIADNLNKGIDHQINITSHTLEPLRGDTAAIEYQVTVYGSYFSEEHATTFDGDALLGSWPIKVPDSVKVIASKDGTWKMSFHHTIKKGQKEDFSMDLFLTNLEGKNLDHDTYSFSIPYRQPCIDPFN